MRTEGRWVLLIPLICFAIGGYYYTSDRTDVRVLFERAREHWRSGAHQEAIQSYLAIQEKYPASRFAPECLWEAATIFYFNLYDISNAIYYFERLINEYPESRWATQSHLKLAELFDVELNEPGNALRHWEAVLVSPVDEETRTELAFLVAEAHFKMGDFELSFEEFNGLAKEAEPGSEQEARAKLRLATIHQIRREHESAMLLFEEVLGADPSPDSRLRAQLGMIESLEFLDRLPEAIDLAGLIEVEDPETRTRLLHRLSEKQKFYLPGQWREP